jgi:hypothetical protein
MGDKRRKYTVVTLFSVLAAVAVLVLVLVILMPQQVTGFGLEGTGMIWGLLVVWVAAAAMVIMFYMFVLNRNGKGVRRD